MASKETKVVNKAEAIRQLLQAQPDLRPIQIIEDLKRRGIDVVSAQVSQVRKGLLAKQGGTATPPPPAPSNNEANNQEPNEIDNLLDDALVIKQAVRRLGKDRVVQLVELFQD